jgi:hypothetical protein
MTVVVSLLEAMIICFSLTYEVAVLGAKDVFSQMAAVLGANREDFSQLEAAVLGARRF